MGCYVYNINLDMWYTVGTQYKLTSQFIGHNNFAHNKQTLFQKLTNIKKSGILICHCENICLVNGLSKEHKE